MVAAMLPEASEEEDAEIPVEEQSEAAEAAQPEQAEQALLESPFHDSFHAELLVNGRALRSEGSSGFAWGQDAEQDAAERAVLAHYALEPAEHWQLWRLHFPWKRRQAVKTLTLTLTADPVWLPGPQFTAQPGQSCSSAAASAGLN